MLETTAHALTLNPRSTSTGKVAAEAQAAMQALSTRPCTPFGNLLYHGRLTGFCRFSPALTQKRLSWASRIRRTFPGSVDGQSVEAWTTDSGDTYTASSKSLNHDRLFYYLGDDIHDNVLTLKATAASTPDDGKDDNKGDDKGDVTKPDDKDDNTGDNTGDNGTTTPDDKGDVVAPDKGNTGKDNTSTSSNKGNGTTTTTPTAPRKNVEVSEHGEIAAAIANGTWGNEYTVCTSCGYHNWTRKGNVYVCDHCGHEVLTVKGADGVKGYAGTLAGNEPQYASTSEAQAAAEKREAAYAASIAALQAQVAAREAAYAASLGIH